MVDKLKDMRLLADRKTRNEYEGNSPPHKQLWGIADSSALVGHIMATKSSNPEIVKAVQARAKNTPNSPYRSKPEMLKFLVGVAL